MERELYTLFHYQAESGWKMLLWEERKLCYGEGMNLEITPNDARALAGFIVRYLRLCDEDAPFEEFDRWRAEVRNRFPEQPEKVLLTVQEEIMKLR